jgi:S-adenosylmethionine synthetase
MAAPTRQYLFTSESVTEGHPDKVADQISDGVLDAVMAQDPLGRVACETLVNTGLVVVSGEISTSASFDVQEIARETIRTIGYVDADLGFSADSCAVLNAVDKQSADIAQGVDAAYEMRQHSAAGDEFDAAGAGDQGMMFGYASNETPELMSLPIALAHRLARRVAEVRKDGTMGHLRPDGKTQVSVRYRDGRPVATAKLLISTQHQDGRESGLRDELWEHVVARPVSVMVETFGTEADGITRERIEALVADHFDLRPAAFRQQLDLHRPIYQQTAAYGHFGRDEPDFTWERTDEAADLRDAAGLADQVAA